MRRTIPSRSVGLVEDVRAKGADRRAAPRKLQHRAVPEHRLVLGAAEDQPRPAAARPPRLVDAPAAGHLQVTAQDETALEAQQQVLPHRLDRLEAEAVEALREPLHGGAGMRRLDLDALADEHL